MAKTIAIFNQKGGVGKSTTSINLGAALAEKKQRVLVIDNDPQGNTTGGFGINEVGNTLYNLLIEDIDIRKAIIHTEFGVDVIPSNLNLSNAELELSDVDKRYSILWGVIEPIKEEYDFILIDCPPSLGLLSVNALAASDYLIVPIEPGFFSVLGVKDLLKTIQLVIKNRINPELQIMGVLITKYDTRTNMSKELKDVLAQTFKDRMFDTVIRKNAQIGYAQDNQLPITHFDRSSNGYLDYMNLAKEVMNYGTETNKEKRK